MRTDSPLAPPIERMGALLAPLAAGGDPRAYLLGTYLRTTRAVDERLSAGAFDGPAWTERLDLCFVRRSVPRRPEAVDASRTAFGP